MESEISHRVGAVFKFEVLLFISLFIHMIMAILVFHPLRFTVRVFARHLLKTPCLAVGKGDNEVSILRDLIAIVIIHSIQKYIIPIALHIAIGKGDILQYHGFQRVGGNAIY